MWTATLANKGGKAEYPDSVEKNFIPETAWCHVVAL